MPQFTCPKCSKKFARKDYLDKHLKRKNPCIERDSTFASSKCNHFLASASSKCNPIFDNFLKKSKKTGNLQNPEYKCDYCEKTYKYRQNKHRHMKTCSKKKEKENEEKNLKMIIKTLKSEKKSLILEENFKNNKKKIKIKKNNDIKNNNNFKNDEKNIKIISIIQNNTKININNLNINLNPFGKENLENIKKKDIIKILNKAYEGIPTALKEIHYNIPENRNFYQPNINKPYIKYYDGKRWMSQKIEDISWKLNNKLNTTLEEWFEKYQTNIKNHKKKLLESMIDNYNEGKMESHFNKEFKLFLLNYSSDIKQHFCNELDKMLEQQ